MSGIPRHWCPQWWIQFNWIFKLTGRDLIGGDYVDTGENTCLNRSFFFDPNRHCLPQNVAQFQLNSQPSESPFRQRRFSLHCRILTRVSFQFSFPGNFDGCWFGMSFSIIQVYDWSNLIMTTTIPQPASFTIAPVDWPGCCPGRSILFS